MLVLDQSNSYMFANMVVTLTDNTVIQDETVTSNTKVPDFNILIPTVQDVGVTNTLELFYPGTPNSYINAHGKPNALKYGFGPDFIHGILSNKNSGVGVYTINLRGESATMSNIIVLMKYKVEKDVPYVDESGNPYYVDANGQLVTTATNATPVVRDVLHVKYETANITNCKKWTDLLKAMSSLYSETPDDAGYATIPFFAVMYRGATAFGNNVYFNMNSKIQEYDGNTYFAVSLFDGINTTTTDSIFSLDKDSGAKYDTTYFMETLFNQNFVNLRFIAAEPIEDIYAIFNRYLYTIDDYIAGTTNKPSKSFAAINPFAVNEFGVVVDEGSIDPRLPDAFALSGGSDGTETPDELFEKFFRGEILDDIASVLRYRYHYIPDIGYNDATKRAIKELIKKRSRMTTATFMVGGTDTFASALIDHQANWYESTPNIRQIAKVQSPMMYNEFVRRTITYPASYFDTMALIAHFVKWTNFYQPFAGADARWTGFIEDTMLYPSNAPEFINSLYKNRVNVVMKDSEAGAYLADQQMNTQLTSDQTELNNAFLISNILYDLLNLVHRNHFKFNEAEEVRMFHEAVNDVINEKYAPYSAYVSVDVYRMGTIGRAKSTNKIKVTIDMKDINKFADIELVLVDN